MFPGQLVFDSPSLVDIQKVSGARLNNDSNLGAALEVGLYQGIFVKASWSGKVLTSSPSSLFFIS